jgi:hypothetical protein
VLKAQSGHTSNRLSRMTGRNQAVRIPREFEFPSEEGAIFSIPQFGMHALRGSIA